MMMTALTAVVIGFAWVGVGAIVGTLVGRWLGRAQGYTVVVTEGSELDPEAVVRALNEEAKRYGRVA